SSADNGAVAYPAGDLAGHPAGRGGRREITAPVSGDGTDCAVHADFTEIPSTPNTASFELVLQFSPAPFTEKIARCCRRDALFPATGKRRLPDQQYWARSLHDRARGQYRIARSEDASNRTRTVIVAVHHRGVHLLYPGSGKNAASSGIEQRIVLEGYDCFS